MHATTERAAPARANRLAREKSPYLLQHQFNPVDWFAWGPEAFAKARAEGKPIFLSIGYSTCHWCHVMERESFENEAIARLLNEHFVCIKVDREERPDLDRIYMSFVTASTGQGGWPMSVFLTPEGKPFFGGTYFPPASRYGRPGFPELLRQIHQVWSQRQAEVVNSAEQIHRQLQEALAGSGSAGAERTPGAAPIGKAAALFKGSYDARAGGFGGAPKFPSPSQPQLLLRYGRRFHDPEAVRMVLHTCDAMAAGGIHDQLGGGFARYSVDAHWRVPHFEKMLYDNAQLAQLYLEAFLVSNESRYAEVVRDILGYVQRDMTHPEGGFYSAEDADSEGHEGKFYCWTRAELARLLTPEEFNVAVRYFGLTEQGNFVDHSHPQPLPGQNVLSVVEPNLPESDQGLLAAAKQRLFAARAQRVRPHLDDKVLASWNGLMLGAFARAYAVLAEESYRAAAEKALAFLKRHLWAAGGLGQAGGTLYHRWREGERDEVQLLEGYAFLLAGVLELYEATVEGQHLEFALALAETMLARFYDAEQGGFWQSAAGSEELIWHLKEDQDGALPSGNSVAALALLKLDRIAGREDLLGAAQKTLGFFAERLEQYPQALTYMLQALDFSLEEPKRVVVAGDPTSREVSELLHTVHGVYQPNKVVLGNRGPVEALARSLKPGKAAEAFICTGMACQAPTSEPKRIQELLLDANTAKGGIS